ncbi:MAG: adenylate/guanylate cyclase domain-containing protein [Methylococcaceae bacterium]
MGTRAKFFKTYSTILLIAGCIALFSLTPSGIYLEEEFGLSWLFKFRDEIPPSEKIIIVSIDKLSAEILHLPENPEKWPRSYYAQLIEKINQQNPSVIAFNMIFDEVRDEYNDQLLAKAIGDGKNIILSNYLKRNIIKTNDSTSQLSYESIVDSLPVFEKAALGSAPFLLPKTASTVKQFWTSKKSAGDIATFPVAIFQSYIFKQAYQEIVPLLYQLNSPSNFRFPKTFQQFADKTDVFEAIQRIQTELVNNDTSLLQFNQLINQTNYSNNKKQLLISWLAMLKASDSSLYFNHYGRAGHITTIPFYQALVSDILKPDLFTDKIVLIGYSENIEPEKRQGLYTIFSTNNSEVSSPIEIAATAVANLIDNSWVKPLYPLYQFFLVFGWSLLLISICCFSSYKKAVSLVIALNMAYLYLAYEMFVNTYIWFPLFTPIILLTLFVLMIKSISHFFKGRKDHQKMQKAFSLYLPDDVVSSISTQHDANSMNLYGELMQGVCMATDAGQYTTLSESMEPQKLNDLMNAYYGVMFPLVKKYQGMISDILGDAMFAIWPRAVHEQQHRTHACITALEILTSIDQFNDFQPDQLPTRIGLHFGDIRLGNVGADYHYEYRAVGDTVNTATRIEGLNKLLGTRILVSADVINDLKDFFTREIGVFLLKGKTKPIHIYELMGKKSDPQNPRIATIVTDFSKALNLFKQQQWSEALDAWLDIERIHPGDGPTLFYIQYLKQNNQKLLVPSNHNQSTVIKIGNITTSLALHDKTGIE